MADPICAVPACERPVRCRGWCHMHYTRWSVTGDPEAVQKAARADWGGTCTVDGCETRVKSRGYCNKHYRRLLKFGDVAVSKIDREHNGGCAVEGCARTYFARGWCSMHLQRVNGLGDPGTAEPKWQLYGATCTAPGCDRPHRSYGYCATHAHVLVFVPRRRAAVDEQVRLEVVVERDQWRCGICREPVDPDLRHPDPKSKSLDHIVPIARGGRHAYRNVQLAHLICNIRKRDKLDYIA